jgi:hypothetical protein
MWYEQFEKITRTIIKAPVNTYFKRMFSLLIARSQPSLKEVSLALEGAIKIMGLKTNQEKKYMITSQNTKQSENITTGNCIFEVVRTFTHLGSSANCNDDISQEIKK